MEVVRIDQAGEAINKVIKEEDIKYIDLAKRMKVSRQQIHNALFRCGAGMRSDTMIRYFNELGYGVYAIKEVSSE